MYVDVVFVFMKKKILTGLTILCIASLTACGMVESTESVQDVIDTQVARFTVGEPEEVSSISAGKYVYDQLSEDDQLVYDEILDAMGARTNAEWFPTRECVAILKNFSTSTYELLHIHVSAPYYSLGDMQESFKQDTLEHLRFMTEVIRLSLINLFENTTRLGITIDQTRVNYVFKEILVVPKLKRNMPSTEPGSVKHRIDAMAINVLNSTEDMKNFKKLFESSVSDWDKLDFDFLSETKIRSLEVNMHTLQSMYDTYISDSETEDTDDDLRKVRGRISVILHLLRIASIYIHFYERHIHGNPMAVFADKANKRDCTRPVACVNQEAFYTAILKYLAYYIETFQNEGRQLCSLLLQRYSITKTVKAKVPP